MAKERDKRIDILRAIALIGIILAHVNPSIFLLQLRSFDVPLMALLMGTSFYISNKERNIKLTSYFVKRLKRLLIPTWQFLTLFFVLFFIVSIIKNEVYYFDIQSIIRSYLLIDGIGYVWVVGVFIAVAILNPLLLKMSSLIKSNLNYFLMLVGFYCIYMLLIVIHDLFLSGMLALLFQNFVLTTCGYGIAAAIGIRLKNISNKEIMLLIVVFSAICLTLAYQMDFALTNVSKYPPTIYYLSYAFAVSLFLYLLLENKYIFNVFDNYFFYFISRNSFWFYFWHIIPVYFLKLFGDELYVISSNTFISFVFVFVIAWLITLLQIKLQTMKINKSLNQTVR